MKKLFEFIQEHKNSFTAEEIDFLKESKNDIDVISTKYGDPFLRQRLVDEMMELLPRRTNGDVKPTVEACTINVLKWWNNHKEIYEAFAQNGGKYWDKIGLSLVYKGQVPIEPDFTKASKVVKALMYRPVSDNQIDSKWNISFSACKGNFLSKPLQIIWQVYLEVIAEGKIKVKDGGQLEADFKKGRDVNPNLDISTVEKFKEYLKENPIRGKNENGIFNKLDLLKESVINAANNTTYSVFDNEWIEKAKINKFSDIIRALQVYIVEKCKNIDLNNYSDRIAIHDKICFAIDSIFSSNQELIKWSIIQEIGATQVDNKGVTQTKFGLTLKLLNLWYNIYNCVSWNLEVKYDRVDSIEELNNNMTLNPIYSPETAKVRLDGGRFQETHKLNYDQMFDKIVPLMNGGYKEENLIISLHPLDMVMSSFGRGWSSCHNEIPYTDYLLPWQREEKMSVSGNFTGGGCSNGNFSDFTGKGLIVYKPYAFTKDPINKPQWGYQKLLRFRTYFNEGLTALRMNYVYPGKQQGEETNEEYKVIAKTAREIIQNVIRTVNNTSGSGAWKVSAMGKSIYQAQTDLGYPREYCNTSRYLGYNNDSSGFSDPCMCRAVVKDYTEHKPVQIGGSPVCINNPNVMMSSGGAHHYSTVVGSKTLTENSRDIFLCECVINGKKCQVPFNIIKYSYLKTLHYCEDINMMSGNAIEVIVDKYYHTKMFSTFDEKIMGKCKECGKIFLKTLMFGEYCIEHCPRESVGIGELAEAWSNGQIAITLDGNNNKNLILLLHEHCPEIVWKSGRSLNDFVPNGNKVLIVKDGKAMTASPEFVKITTVRSEEFFASNSETKESDK